MQFIKANFSKFVNFLGIQNFNFIAPRLYDQLISLEYPYNKSLSEQFIKAGIPFDKGPTGSILKSILKEVQRGYPARNFIDVFQLFLDHGAELDGMERIGYQEELIKLRQNKLLQKNQIEKLYMTNPELFD